MNQKIKRLVSPTLHTSMYNNSMKLTIINKHIKNIITETLGQFAIP